MKYQIIIAMAGLAALAGCTSVATVPTPTGGTGIRVACNQIANCYRRAADVCGPKWRIIDASNAMKPTPQIIIVCEKGANQ